MSLTTKSTWENLQANRTTLSGLGNIEYRYFLEDWRRSLDVIEGGEREVKERGEEYLPKTSGQKARNKDGDDIYCAYKERAVFYGYSKDTVIAMLGVMHSKPAKIELTAPIAAMNEEAQTPEGWRVGLGQMLREINRNQLTYGRYGLLVDMPDVETPTMEAVPKILAYEAFFILDWGTRELPNGDIILDYVLLAEEKEDRGRAITYENPELQLRVLALDANMEYYSLVVEFDTDNIKAAEALGNIDLDIPPPDAVYPVANDERLNFIPFVFINVTDLEPDIEKSPTLQLTNMDISIYRGDADWAQAYFMQGQATPVISGSQNLQDELLFGAGGFLHLPDSESKAYYMEVKGDGMEEMRERQTSLQTFAVSLGIALVDQNAPESGVALETRAGIKSAPLKTIAKTGAKGLLQALRYAHFWKTGEMPEDEMLQPNLDFSTSTKAAKELLDLWSAKLGGAPISTKDVHTFAKENNFSTKSFEETQEDIAEEI